MNSAVCLERKVELFKMYFVRLNGCFWTQCSVCPISLANNIDVPCSVLNTKCCFVVVRMQGEVITKSLFLLSSTSEGCVNQLWKQILWKLWKSLEPYGTSNIVKPHPSTSWKHYLKVTQISLNIL